MAVARAPRTRERARRTARRRPRTSSKSRAGRESSSAPPGPDTGERKALSSIAVRHVRLLPEFGEGADERRTLLTRPARHLPLEVFRGADRAAQQGHPLGLALTPTAASSLASRSSTPPGREPRRPGRVSTPGHFASTRRSSGAPLCETVRPAAGQQQRHLDPDGDVDRRPLSAACGVVRPIEVVGAGHVGDTPWTARYCASKRPGAGSSPSRG